MIRTVWSPLTGAMMRGVQNMFDRGDHRGRNEGCGGGVGTWGRLAGRPARVELDRRLAFLETADVQDRERTTIEETSRLAWRRAIRRWMDLGGSTMSAGRRAEAFQRAGRKREMREWRAHTGGARTYVRNGVRRVEGVRAQQRREEAEERGRRRRAWVQLRREAEKERQRAATATAARYRARRLALLAEARDSGATERPAVRQDVRVWESVAERSLVAERRRREEASRVRHERRRAQRWGLDLPPECRGGGSARAVGMVKRAREWEWKGEGGMVLGGGQRERVKRAKGLGREEVVAARTESTHWRV